MPPMNQENLPMIFLLQGGESFLGAIPLPFILGGPGGIVRPDQWALHRPTKGSVISTADNSFLDDFGAGVPTLTMSGSTGWSGPLDGIVALKSLELLLTEYLNRRARTAAAFGNPDDVTLYYFDTLQAQAFTLYPFEMGVDRSKRSPLLYYYRLRFAVLRDLLNDTVIPAIADAVTSALGSSGITSTLSTLAGLF